MGTSSITSSSARTPARFAAPLADLGDVAARVRKHVPALDGLRGLAIFVVIVHTPGTLQKHAAAWYLKLLYFLHAPGWVGVQLFFALSGFLITGLLVDARGKVATGQALRTFWVRRALRIFPLYYVVLLLTTVLVPSLIAGTPGELVEVADNRIWYWAYLCNWAGPNGHEIGAFSHFWSLAVEEQFYLVWPLVVLALGNRALLRVCVGAAVVAFLARIALRASGASPIAVYEYTVARMDALTLGAGAAIVARDPALLARVAPLLSRVMVGCVVVLSLMWPVTRGFNLEDVWVQTVGYGLLSVACVALILRVVIAPTSALGACFQAPWLRWLGKYSYGIYVFHHPIMKALGPRLGPALNGDDPHAALLALVEIEAIVISLSILLAVVSWNLLERWALRLKDRWAPAAPVGVALR